MEIVRPTHRLRPLVPADAASLARHANDRGIWLHLRDRFPHPYTVADAEAFIASAASLQPPTVFAIDVGGDAVGTIGLVPGHDIERVGAEIGYWIGRAYWGRGIVTEAVAAATDHAFGSLGLRRVFAVPFVHNHASRRVLEKAGYVQEGVMRRSAVKDGELLDQCLYAACDDRWPRRRGEGGSSASAPGFVVRPAREEDAGRLQAVREAAFAPVFASFRSALGAELYEIVQAREDRAQGELLASLLAPRSGWEVAVAEVGGEVAGFVSWRLDHAARVGEIGLNAVHPDRAGHGIGTALYEHAVARMREARMRAATVATGADASHAAARRAYRKAGFVAEIPSLWMVRAL